MSPAAAPPRVLCLTVSERIDDPEESRTKDDQEHRGEDQHDEREQNLDRRLVGALLRGLPPALAHLDGEVTENLTDRDAESLALHHRPHEGLHARRLAASHPVLQRIERRETQVLLLDRQAELVTERTADPLCGDAQGGGEGNT